MFYLMMFISIQSFLIVAYTRRYWYYRMPAKADPKENFINLTALTLLAVVGVWFLSILFVVLAVSGVIEVMRNHAIAKLKDVAAEEKSAMEENAVDMTANVHVLKQKRQSKTGKN